MIKIMTTEFTPNVFQRARLGGYIIESPMSLGKHEGLALNFYVIL